MLPNEKSMAWSIGRNCLTKNHWNPQWFTHFFSENRTLSTRLHVIRGAILAHGHHPPSHLGHVLAPSGTTWGQVRRGQPLVGQTNRAAPNIAPNAGCSRTNKATYLGSQLSQLRAPRIRLKLPYGNLIVCY